MRRDSEDSGVGVTIRNRLKRPKFRSEVTIGVWPIGTKIMSAPLLTMYEEEHS